MAQTDTLQMTESRNDADEHFFKFFCFPEDAHLFALSVHILQVESMLNVLADNSNPKGIIHSLIEEISIELNDVRVVLCLKQLDCLLLLQNTCEIRACVTYLILIEFVKSLRFNFLEGVVLTRL